MSLQTARERDYVAEAQQSEQKQGVATVFSHVLVAVVAAGLAIWIYGQASTATPPGAAPSDLSASATASPADTLERAQIEAADAAETPQTGANVAVDPAHVGGLRFEGDAGEQAEAPLRIVADPEHLRVWHNTRVTLRAEPGDGRVFTKYVWHFEDGSDPESGEVVAHVFPESVGDRHVTLQAWDEDGTKLVVSRTLPIERLDVVALDGVDSAVQELPAPKGVRLLLVGELDEAWVPQLGRLAEGSKADAVITMSSQSAQILARRWRPEDPLGLLPIVVVPAGAAHEDAPEPPAPSRPLFVQRDVAGRIKTLVSGTSEVAVLQGVALVAHDSRSDGHDEVAVVRTFRGMQAASAYDATLLLTARPLAAFADSEAIAESGFRLYEHALRTRVRAVVSGASGLAWDGRYGGLEAVSVGTLAKGACRRLKGHDDCQSPTVTVLDVPRSGRVRAWHLRAPNLQTWLTSGELPSAVGKYRR